MKIRGVAKSLSIVAACLVACFGLTACNTKGEQPTGQKIPDGFKINCYPKSECTRVDTTPLGDKKFAYVVILKTKDDRFKIETFYKTEIAMSGYKLLNDIQNANNIQMKAVNDEYNLDIDIITVEYQTIVSISWRPR